MEYVTVYEIEEFNFPWITLGLMVACIFSICGVVKCFKEHLNTKKIFSGDLLGCIFFVLLIIITLFLAYISHLAGGSIKGNIASKYYSGEFLEVTGTVEEYYNYENHNESFVVDGIYFRYTIRNDKTWQYFQDYDNVIYRNGQNVKIRYNLDSNNCPEIVYIGELAE